MTASHSDSHTPLPAPTLAQLQARAEASPADLNAQLDHGAALHAAGRPEHALVAFEKAVALAPTSVDAVSACATLLFELSRPQAAYQLLGGIREQLLATADGAANLGIAAEACGLPAEAQACYTRALELDPDNVRALNNMALLSASQGRWEVAVPNAHRCVALLPDEPTLWVNLADVLTGARDYGTALDVLQQAMARFGAATDLRLRQAVVLAFSADFDGADAALAALGPQAASLLLDYLATGSTAIAGDALPKRAKAMLPTMRELFTQQAFQAMQLCDWRYHDPLVAVLRELLAHATRTGEARDWRDAEFYGLALPLDETEMAAMRGVTGNGIAASLAPTAAPFTPGRSLRRDGRLHIGLAVQNLRDPRVANALARRLALHDASRFAIHVYSPTPRPEANLSEPLRAITEGVVEIAHMNTEEAVARIRLDNLDLFMDMAFYTPWCKPEVFSRHVAPVQLRELAWQRHHAPRNNQYTISDRFIHPDGLDLTPYGNIVRMPHSCWMAANDDQPAGGATRAGNGLPDDALVLCAFTSSMAIDPQTFALWMQVLRSLPAAVLWLPNFPVAARANLAREALAAGVSADRLVFAGPGSRPDVLARMQLADVYLDTLRYNAGLGLADALRMGVPAVACAGNSMSSRMGAGMIRAVGLPDCVLPDAASYKDAVVSLGRDPSALKALRGRLAAAIPTAALFDTASRVKEWEYAWQTMIERQRAGLAPQAFDVPDRVNAPANP